MTTPKAHGTVPGQGFGYTSSRTRTGPDPAVVRDQLHWLQEKYKLYGESDFCRMFMWILLKEQPEGQKQFMPEGFWNKKLVPFVHNRVQVDITQHRRKRNIYLKYRQGGYTTYMIVDRLYLPAIIEPGSGCLLVSQNHFYAAQHFAILKRAHRYILASNPYDYAACAKTRWFHENALHTANSNRRELIFDQLDSKILVDSAEQEEVGQGLTINHFVATEVARWPGKPDETLANVKESIPQEGTIDYESTANGYGGYFFEECMRAREKGPPEPEFKYFFHEWWWHDEYRAKKGDHPNEYVSGDKVVTMEELLDDEATLRKKVKLDLEQIAWRRIKKISLRHNFDEKYPEDDVTCFLVSGKSFFDRDILRFRLLELKDYKPLDSRRHGELEIYNKRIRGRKYLIGADTAQGRVVTSEDSDYCAAVVYDEETGEEMASYRARVTPEDFTEDLVELGSRYNMAMIAVERGTGGDGGVVLYKLTEMKYWNIYKHRDRFRARKTGSMKPQEFSEVPGLPINPKTRSIACNRLREFVEKNPELVYDKEFIKEAINFVRDEKGVPRGGGDEENAHDDRVMCRAVGMLARFDNLGLYDPQTSKTEKYGQEQTDEPEGEAAA